MKNESTTKMLFLYEKDSGEVFAYFPHVAESHDGKIKMCYAHLGQHSSCHVDYANECKQAAPDDYFQLYQELRNIGYKIQILNRQKRYHV